MKASPTLIKVLLADDHALLREGFSTLIRKVDSGIFDIVDEVGNGKELLEKVALLQPDVVITDVQMPVMSGIEATLLLKKKFPHIRIIALSGFSDSFVVSDMLEAGADGYLLKNASKEEIALAITTVYEGGMYFSRDEKVQAGKEFFKMSKRKAVTTLSEREKEITHLISKEYSNKEIANQLNLSVRSVESYRERIIGKVGAKNFIGVIMHAVKKGWFKSDI